MVLALVKLEQQLHPDSAQVLRLIHNDAVEPRAGSVAHQPEGFDPRVRPVEHLLALELRPVLAVGVEHLLAVGAASGLPPPRRRSARYGSTSVMPRPAMKASNSSRSIFVLSPNRPSSPCLAMSGCASFWRCAPPMICRCRVSRRNDLANERVDVPTLPLDRLRVEQLHQGRPDLREGVEKRGQQDLLAIPDAAPRDHPRPVQRHDAFPVPGPPRTRAGPRNSASAIAR